MTSSQFLDVPGGRLAYDVQGPDSGPLVVGLHGMGDSRATFRFLTPLLTSRGYRVATLDARGHGESTAGWPDTSQQSTGADLAALIRHLGGPAIVAGNSSGAGSAAFLAATEPGLVTGLVLISAFASEPTPNPVMAAAQYLVLRSPLLWGLYFRSLFTTRKPADLGDYVSRMRATLRQPGRMAAVRGVVAPGNAHWSAVAGQIRCPVLIVHGSKDPDYPDPAAAAREAQALLTGAASTEIAMIDGAGHYPQAEMPEKTAQAMDTLLTAARA
ncbi:MAG: hypothetical protein QOJ50_2719 [Cryptosporangiaceae bacterium]|nr:hypothetical protein [Cryptosporangiaceae bacterium]